MTIRNPEDVDQATLNNRKRTLGNAEQTRAYIEARKAGAPPGLGQPDYHANNVQAQVNAELRKRAENMTQKQKDERDLAHMQEMRDYRKYSGKDYRMYDQLIADKKKKITEATDLEAWLSSDEYVTTKEVFDKTREKVGPNIELDAAWELFSQRVYSKHEVFSVAVREERIVERQKLNESLDAAKAAKATRDKSEAEFQAATQQVIDAEKTLEALNPNNEVAE